MTDFEIQQLLIKKGREFEQRIREMDEKIYNSYKEDAAKYLVSWQPASEETQFIIDCFWAAEYLKGCMPHAISRRLTK